MPQQPRGRLAALDLLRALAVLLVMLRHVLPEDGDVSGWSVLAPVARALGRGGWVGVDLFFVLSGFLVSGLLFAEFRERGSVRIGRFLVRRGFKIYPGFWALLAFAIAQQLHSGGIRWPTIASEGLFIQNYGPAYFWHTWSLAVEEHFYLLCALLLFGLVKLRNASKDPFRALPWISVGVAGTCLAARIVTSIAAPYAHKTHLFPTHLRLDGLMLGVVLGYFYHFERPRLERLVRGQRAALWAIGAAALLPAFLWPLPNRWIHTVGLSLFSCGSGLMLLAAVTGPAPRGRLAGTIATIGSYSYSIYLWHLPLLFRLRRYLPNATPAMVLLYLAITIVAGVAMARLVELPFLRLRERLCPPRSIPIQPALEVEVS